MAVLAADRIERPPTLFDVVEGPPAASALPAASAAPASPVVPAPPAFEPAVDAGPVPDGAAAGGAVHEHDGVGGEFTLDELLVGAWEGLTAQAAATCPLCDGTLRPLYAGASAAEPVVAGRCDSCGTTLS
jgi:hypothetical protein